MSGRFLEPGERDPVVRRERLTDERIAGIASLAEALDFRVFIVELEGCHDKADLLERATKALGFPRSFGGNWDAWFDCLVDLSWHPAATGYVILFRNAQRLLQAAPESLDTALAIVGDACRVWADRGVTLRAFIDDSAAT